MNIAESIATIAQNLDKDAREDFFKAQAKTGIMLAPEHKGGYKVVVFPDGSAIDSQYDDEGEIIHTVLTEREAFLASCWAEESKTVIDNIAEFFS